MRSNGYSYLLVLCLMLAACTPGIRQDRNKTVFRYNESSGITSLDPAFARNQANIWADNQIFNGLVQLNDKLEVLPCIARKWEVSADGTTYTFHLRNDVCFHEDLCFGRAGTRKVVASDFVFSFLRITDPSVASPGNWVFGNVAQEQGKYAFMAPDDSTFVIRLKSPFPAFAGILTMQYCSVVPREAVEFYGKDFRKHPVGTGPFRFKMWKEGVRLVLVKNVNYFEADGKSKLPYLDAVSISFIVDKQSAFLEFVKGNLDFMSGLDVSYKDEVLNPAGTLKQKYRDRFCLVSQPYLNTEYLGFLMDPAIPEVKDSPLRFREVRQAINMGFDRVKMMRYLRNNIGIPGIYGMVPPGLPSSDTAWVKGYRYDPEEARRLLAKAGFDAGHPLPPISLSTNASYLDLCKYMQFQLSEVGIDLRLDVNPPAHMREMVAQSKLGFFRGSWIADYPDAENYLSLFYSHNFSPGGPNYTHFSDPEADKLYELAQKETVDSVRYRYYREMDRRIMEQAPVVVLYYDQVLRFLQKNIRGLGSNPLNLLTLKYVQKMQ